MRKLQKDGKGWFMRFEERCRLHNIEVQSEATHADVKAAETYSDLAKRRSLH